MQQKLANAKKTRFCSQVKTVVWSLALMMSFYPLILQANLWKKTMKAKTGAMKTMMNLQPLILLLKLKKESSKLQGTISHLHLELTSLLLPLLSRLP